MGFIYSPAFLAFIGLLVADVAAGLALQGLARAQLRLGNWSAADCWYRRRLAAPLPATRLLLDAFHGQRPWLEYERLQAMSSSFRYESAARYGAELAATTRTPDWLRIIGAAQAAEQLTERGHFGEALTRLEALGSDVPAQAPALGLVLEGMRLRPLTALGRWEEAEATAAIVDGAAEIGARRGWPVRGLTVLLARDEEREALRRMRPLLQAWESADASSADEHESRLAWSGLLLAARAAEEIGWAELRDRLVARLLEWTGPAPPAPILAALEARAAADRADLPGFDRAAERLVSELSRLGEAEAAAQEAHRLLARAESRVGRHQAAITRARSMLERSLSPVSRWRMARILGEVAAAAGEDALALEAHRAALATCVESRLVPEIRARVARLESA